MHFFDLATTYESKTDCWLVLAAFENNEFALPSNIFLPEDEKNVVHKQLSQLGFQGKSEQLAPVLDSRLTSKILVIGCGKKADFSLKGFKKSILAACKQLQKWQATEVAWAIGSFGLNLKEAIRHLILTCQDTGYSLGQLKTEREATPDTYHALITQATQEGRAVLAETQAIAKAVAYAKDLGNLPSNICTPTYLAEEAEKLAKNFAHICTEIIDDAQMLALGLNCLHAVGRGSAEPSKLVIMHYQGTDATEKPYVMVGKGITFDTGGVCIKPSEGMQGMTMDMSGAGAVISVMQAVAELKLPINLIGLMACAENMPGGNAFKPRDILKSHSGKTVEIIDTDAEGRMVLCDALSYAKQYQPKTMIDLATLTGACMVALGHHHSGLFTSHSDLQAKLVQAGNEMLDTLWPMPMDKEYDEELKSDLADLKHLGSRFAGAVTAARFLAHFVDAKTPWAHIDIAGTAIVKQATGRPVAMLTQYFINEAKA